MTTDEVAALLRCEAATVRRYVHNHELTAIQIGRERRFQAEDVLEFIAAPYSIGRSGKRDVRKGRGAEMPEAQLLTGEQVAEYLNIPFDPGHIERLRAREKLPHVVFCVNGERHCRYPLDELRQWINHRLRVGHRLVSKHSRK